MPAPSRRPVAAAALFALAALPGFAADAGPGTPAAPAILQHMLDADPWGLAGTELSAHLTLSDARGRQRVLAFTAASRKTGPGLSKLLVRFTRPGALAGAGMLLVQNRERDDDRYLFLPDEKRARRITANSREQRFMGTDYSFADFDRKDLRDGAQPVLRGVETLANVPCFHLDVATARPPYSRIELWIGQDNFLPMRLLFYGTDGKLEKTFTAEEVRRVSERWYVTQSRMVDERTRHATQWVIDQIEPQDEVPDEAVSLRALEKL